MRPNGGRRRPCGLEYGLAFLIVVVSATSASAQILRTAYVTATDQAGQFLTDLTAADLSVKEAGRERAITRVERSTVPMQIAVLVEEGLAPDTRVRAAVFEFAKRMNERANIALILVGRRNETLVDYTTDLEVIARGINAFGMAPARMEEALVEGIFDVAKSMTGLERGRRVIVALAIEHPQTASMSARQALDELQKSGAMFYAATLTSGAASAERPSDAMDQSHRDQVLGDGTLQSGGRRQESPRTSGFPSVLSGIADELLNQYAVTYELPAGVRPEGRLAISAKRKDTRLRAATRIPGN